MKNNKTIYHFVVDQSGSMSGSEGATIEGFNSQLNTLKNLKKANPEQEFVVSVTYFEDEVMDIIKFAPIEQVESLSRENYKPGGLTALLDAIGRSIDRIQQTFSQEIKMDGAIIVSTPQEVALLDVKRGIKMFDKLGVKILGLVDNMSYFTGDDGKKYKIFGEGGVKRTAEEFEKEFLGEIPINPEVGKCGDEGKPIVEANPEHEISKIYLDFARKIKSTYL